MLQKLLDHSQDIAALRDTGYELEVRDGYLIIHHVPYVNAKKEVAYGVLVSELNVINQQTTARPSTHIIYFSGEPPCDIHGKRIEGIYNSAVEQEIIPGLIVNHLFSNKPPEGYSNYFDKISTYVNIIQSPALALNPAATALMYRVRRSEEHPIFKYDNTNASRAKITGLDNKFAGQRVAIVGLGGTGAYVLDAIAKCPIPEIHLFDRDIYYMHNAYRSPGATALETLDRALRKVDYYAELYGRIHKGITAHPDYITPDNLGFLQTMTQVFICIDKPEVKRFLLPFLMKNKQSFIDVGMGLHLVNDTIIGTLRVTTGRPGMYDHLSKRISMAEDENNDYNANIQIAELNGLNAFLAVVQWKKMLGMYGDQMHENNLSYNIDTSQLVDDDYSV